MNKKIKNSKI